MSRSFPLTLILVAMLALPTFAGTVSGAATSASVSVTLMETPDVQTGTFAKVFLVADGAPAAGTVTFYSQYVMPTGGFLNMKVFTVTVGPAGEAAFLIPRDVATFNVPGNHVLIGVAQVDGVTARMSLPYAVSF